MDCSTPGFPGHHQLPELTQTHVHRVGGWCHPTISSSVVPFSSHFQSFPASGSFQMSQFFASVYSSLLCIVKAMVFPVVVYGCENWTIRKADHQRIDAFNLLCWKRLLRVPWTAARSNQSLLKEINLEYSLEGLMLKLRLQYFGHLMRRADSLKHWERLKAQGEGSGRGWDGWMALPTQWTWIWANSSRQWSTEELGMLHSMGSQRVGHNLATAAAAAKSL